MYRRTLITLAAVIAFAVPATAQAATQLPINASTDLGGLVAADNWTAQWCDFLNTAPCRYGLDTTAPGRFGAYTPHQINAYLVSYAAFIYSNNYLYYSRVFAPYVSKWRAQDGHVYYVAGPTPFGGEPFARTQIRGFR